MANSISGRQWLLDTVGVVTTDGVKVMHFEFNGYAAVTDECILKDRVGRIVWQATGKADLSPSQSQVLENWCDGLTVDTLTSGKVAVYIL